MFNNQSKRHIPKPIKGLFFLGIIALFVFILGNVIVYLWNEILVAVTGVKTITFWQAIGLFALARILFGGFRFGPKHRNWKDKKGAHLREKWMGMNEEERAAFKSKWKERCKTKD